MGGERASTTRMRLAGKICSRCGPQLPLSHVRRERLCVDCLKERSPRHSVYMHFMLYEGWYCQFLEADLKTSLPKKLTIRNQQKLSQMAERGMPNMTNGAGAHAA
jgi:hypothetical protein